MKDSNIQVQFSKAVWGEEEIKAVSDVLETTTQMGSNVRDMESKVAQLFAKRRGIMVNSCSSANHLAVEILHLPKSSEVITPVLTYGTTVAPIIKNGLVPVFVDAEEGTYNIDITKLEEMITANTRAMVIPNLLGNLPNWKKIREIADRHKLIVIEDSADTMGATMDKESSGKYSDISTTGFSSSNIITCAGNGGMLCVNSNEYANRAKLLRSCGRNSSLFVESEEIENRFNVDVDGIPYDAKYLFEVVGYNFEPSEMGAAFGIAQLEKLQTHFESRERFFEQHLAFFKQYEEWFVLPKTLEGTRTAWYAFPLTLKENAPFKRTELQIFFEKNGIQTRAIFAGNILRQPGFKNILHRSQKHGYPVADSVTKGGILLPCHHGMTDKMVAHIHETFKLLVSEKVIAA